MSKSQVKKQLLSLSEEVLYSMWDIHKDAKSG